MLVNFYKSLSILTVALSLIIPCVVSNIILATWFFVPLQIQTGLSFCIKFTSMFSLLKLSDFVCYQHIQFLFYLFL